MAIGYTLLGKPVEGIDTSSLNELSDTLLLQEKNREIQRQTWREEQDALRQTQRDLKPSANQDANQFFGRFSGGIMDESLDLQNMLETGQIKSSEYSARWRNLNQTNEQMIAAQKGYQEKAQKITEAVNNGTASVVDAEALNEFNIRFQPGAMEVERDGRGGLRLFNKETGTEVSPSYLSDLVNSSLPKFDYTAAATQLVDSFGKRGILQSSGYSIEGVYANVPTEKLNNIMKEEAEAILSGAQAPTVSILTDGMGYGVVYNREELVAGKNIYRKSDGTFEFAGGDQEAAVNFMATQLENALPKSIKEVQTPVVKPPSDTAIKTQDLRNKEIGYLKSIDNVISGDATTAQASIDAMIQGANVIYGKSPGIQNIKNAERSEDGNTLTVTRVNADGDISEAIPYDISDPNKAGEVMVELFFPNVKGSYEELLTDYNKQGGFTQREIKNPNYKVDEKGLPTDPNEKQFIPNPNYKGASEVGKTKGKVTIEEDFNTAEFLGETAKDVKPLKKVIDDVDVGTYVFSGDANLARSKAMSEGAVKAFEVLKFDIPDLIAKTRATANGLELTIPSLFDGTLTLTNEYTRGGKTKQNYVDAIKQIFNSIAKGTPFDKSKFE